LLRLNSGTVLECHAPVSDPVAHATSILELSGCADVASLANLAVRSRHFLSSAARGTRTGILVLARINAPRFLKKLGELSSRAQNGEDVRSDLDIVLQELIEHAKAVNPVMWREELRVFRARLRVTLQQLEEPDPLLPNKLTDRNNVRSRTFYRDAIKRLSLTMGDKSPV
jgi:hypothetical protein